MSRESAGAQALLPPGATILTVGGRYIDLLDPDPATFDIYDIARALSNLCRYNGHTADFYSVAQHSILCADHAPDGYQFEALMHDAAEAYLGDITRPLKSLLPDYRRIERTFDQALATRFGYPRPKSEAVAAVDLQAAATEKRDLMPARGHFWPFLNGVEPWPEPIVCMIPSEAAVEFVDRFGVYS